METKKSISLPQGDFLFPFTWKSEYLLLSGGRQPSGDWLGHVAKDRKIWAIDRGLDTARQSNLHPSLILGDGDSSRPDVWEWGKILGIPRLIYPRAKDYTDTELALAELGKRDESSFAILTGCFGGRFDHAFSTIFSAAYANVSCCLADEREVIVFIGDGQEVFFRLNENSAQPLAVSLLPLGDDATGVTTEGLLWQLNNATLTIDNPNTVSNEMTGQKFSVSIKTGKLAVYLYFTVNA